MRRYNTKRKHIQKQIDLLSIFPKMGVQNVKISDIDSLVYEMEVLGINDIEAYISKRYIERSMEFEIEGRLFEVTVTEKRISG